ncbi:MAG: S8 family peptidase [Sphingomonadales bacterium]
MGSQIVTKHGLAAIVFGALLSGCGGGGAINAPRPSIPAAAPPPPPPAPTPTPPPPAAADEFRTGEFNLSWGLEAINAAEAYAQGFTGDGVIIGLLDFNFDFASSELDFHPASRGPDPATVALYEAQIGESATTDEHGQAVAVVAAGLKNQQGAHGVAFDAQVLAVDFFSAVNETLVSQDGILFHVSNPWTYLTDNGARVVNKSLGFDEGDVIENPPPVSEKYVLDVDAHVVAEGALLVSSAGNNSDPEPSLSNLNTIDILRDNGLLDSGPGAFMIVGAVDENNQIATFSDQAGGARDYFLVAPGVDVTFPWNGELAVGSGTSFSAPHVTGAAAILFQRWPTLTARDVANILFDSATDLGAAGVDDVFGHGLLNLEAALQPLGVSRLAVQGDSVEPVVTDSAVALGGAFGDAAAFRSGLSQVMMLDGFTRDFAIDLSGFVSSRPARASLLDLAGQKRRWRSAALHLAGTGSMDVAIGEDPWQSAAMPFMGQAALDIGPERELVLAFSGTFSGQRWAAGTGRRLTDALGTRSRVMGEAGLQSMTRAFAPAIDTGAGNYAFADMTLGPTMNLKLGASVARGPGLEDHPVEALRERNALFATAVRLVRYGHSSHAAVEIGTMVENDAVLGSRAAGGLGLTDRSRTVWATVEGEKQVGRQFGLKASFTASLTDPGQIDNSLLQSLGAIASTSFSLGFTGEGLLRHGDVASITIHQPLHVERAPLTLVAGVGRDRETGAVIFGETALSLAPSGREIALEGAYRTALGDWTAEANLAFRVDADHVAGRQDVAAMFWLARPF